MHDSKQGTRYCDRCNEPYEPRKNWQRFCSAGCRDGWWLAVRETAKKLVRPLSEQTL